MNAFLKNSLVLLFTIFLSTNAFAEDPMDKYIEKNRRPSVVGFFNGMNNMKNEAKDNLEALKMLITTSTKIKSKVKPDEETGYELFYNHSEGLTNDLFEVFAQKYRELGLSDDGEAVSFVEIFMALFLSELKNDDIIEVVEKTDPLSPIITLINGLNGDSDLGILARNAVKTLINKYLLQYAKDGEGIMAQGDYITHARQMSKLLETHHKLFLVSHSQGALFLNKAFETVVGGEKAKYPHMQPFVQAYYVAPAADPNKLIQDHQREATYGIQNHNYTLTSSDRTIVESLGSVFPVAPPNISGKGSDIFNHGFIETYLQESSPTRNKIEDDLAAYMNELNMIIEKNVVALILFSFSLKYNINAEDDTLYTHTGIAVREPPSKKYPEGSESSLIDWGGLIIRKEEPAYGLHHTYIDKYTGQLASRTSYWMLYMYNLANGLDSSEDLKFELYIYRRPRACYRSGDCQELRPSAGPMTVSIAMFNDNETDIKYIEKKIAWKEPRTCDKDEEAKDACLFKKEDYEYFATVNVSTKNYGIVLPKATIEE